MWGSVHRPRQSDIQSILTSQGPAAERHLRGQHGTTAGHRILHKDSRSHVPLPSKHHSLGLALDKGMAGWLWHWRCSGWLQVALAPGVVAEVGPYWAAVPLLARGGGIAVVVAQLNQTDEVVITLDAVKIGRAHV